MEEYIQPKGKAQVFTGLRQEHIRKAGPQETLISGAHALLGEISR